VLAAVPLAVDAGVELVEEAAAEAEVVSTFAGASDLAEASEEDERLSFL
jgi:hypothetical protein